MAVRTKQGAAYMAREEIEIVLRRAYGNSHGSGGADTGGYGMFMSRQDYRGALEYAWVNRLGSDFELAAIMSAELALGIKIDREVLAQERFQVIAARVPQELRITAASMNFRRPFDQYTVNPIGVRIGHLRESTGLSREEFAALAGIPESAMADVERGRITAEEKGVVFKILEAFGVDGHIHELLELCYPTGLLRE